VSIYNRRNALVGFLALEALRRRRRAKQLRRNAPKIALFSFVGLAALAAAVGIVAVLLKRRGEDVAAALDEETESEIVGEYVTANSEPIPAT
jgi:hypothetical protein